MWPLAFLFENVRGLARPAFADYLRWIRASLTSPTIERRRGETHDAHRVRIERAKRPSYDVMVLKVNAADFGAPQRRMRVIIAGMRRELGIELLPPLPTHSRERLLWDQQVTGEYWKRHRLRRPECIYSPSGRAPADAPWITFAMRSKASENLMERRITSFRLGPGFMLGTREVHSTNPPKR